MEARLRLKPGENGAKRITGKYGDRLLCVRHLYDADTHKRHETVEPIEETVSWHPRTSRERHLIQPTHDEPMLVRVAYQERELRERVNKAGGQWLQAERASQLPYAVAVSLGLKDRILARYIGPDIYM